jgi:hypothetical protein
MLTDAEIDGIILDRRTSLTPEYWTEAIGDERHFKLVMDTKQPPDYRLLYDSWLWREVITHIKPLSRGTTVLELLPGNSLTIPVALESLSFKGTLVRLNDEPPVPLPTTIGFSEYWQSGQLTDLLTTPLPYELILANHVIDDLLFNLFVPLLEQRKVSYSDPRVCKCIWNAMVNSKCVTQLQKRVVEMLLGVASRMCELSVFILRHYPSTFALKSRDMARMTLEMETYGELAEAIRCSEGMTARFFELSAAKAPAGSKYPDSILVVCRKSAATGIHADSV